MAKTKKSADQHEHVWLKLVYGLPTDKALEAAKAGRVVLARKDRRDGQPKFQCAVCGVQS